MLVSVVVDIGNYPTRFLVDSDSDLSFLTLTDYWRVADVVGEPRQLECSCDVCDSTEELLLLAVVATPLRRRDFPDKEPVVLDLSVILAQGHSVLGASAAASLGLFP